MRFINVLVLVTLLAASMALAGEKVTPNDVVMPESGNRTIFNGTLDENSPTWDRSEGYGPFVGDCNYLTEDAWADGVYYAEFCIEVTDTNPIEVVVYGEDKSVDDSTLYLFCDPFDPADPTTNGNFYNDDGDGIGLMSSFELEDNVTLVPGETYWLVLSTYAPGDMGDFSIEASDNVQECGGVANESINWSSLKAQYK